MAIYRCKEPFAVWLPTGPRTVASGALVDGDDPVYKGREHLFEPVETYVHRRDQGPEQATAAPGEKRSISTPTRPKRTQGRGKP